MKQFLMAVIMAWVGGNARAANPSVEANHVAELTFTSSVQSADPFNQTQLDLVVTQPSGRELRVPAFWAGGQTWRARYASGDVGEHRYATVCSDAADAGLHDQKGVITITPNTSDLPLYRHGFLRVAADKKHFEHADGTPFFWLADTWWMGFTNRLHFPEEFAALTADRVGKGFTVVQIVAGLYPDMPAFDPRGANEAGFPWEKDYARINPAYFDQVDRRVSYLVDHGIAPCIVGAWGYHLPWLGVEKMKQHWRYLIARYGAYPGFWCAAGEAAMPYYLAADKPKDAEFQKRGWTEIVQYIHATDPFNHPVSLHPTDLARTQVTDPSVLDFEMLQTGHGDRASILPTIDFVRRSRQARPTMPTINAEVCYEGILNACHEDVVRIVTWESLLGGTAGHTYGANGIWQLNRKDQPYGKSPHGGTYGPTPWDEAMNLPGSKQVGYAKKLLTKFQWWKFEPHPEWVKSDRDQIEWGDWIWSARDGDAARNAPAQKRTFTKTITMPPDVKVASAIVQITADDQFEAFLNGTRIGGSDGGNESWRRPVKLDLAPALKPGENVLKIDAENVAANVPNNPAGLLVGGAVKLIDGTSIPLASDGSWSDAKTIAKYGDGPWGRVGGDQGAIPAACGDSGSSARDLRSRRDAHPRDAIETRRRLESRVFQSRDGRHQRRPRAGDRGRRIGNCFPAGRCAGLGAGPATIIAAKECARMAEGAAQSSDVSVAQALAGTPGENSIVTIKGWVRTRRDSKGGFSFIAINDGSCFDSIQVVAPNTLSNYADEVMKLTAGCSAIVSGKLVKSQGKGQAFEIQGEQVNVVGWVDDPDTYPIQPKPHTMEFLREVAHLRPRTNTFGALTRVRHTLSMAIHRFFHERGFYWVHTPIITTSDCEGAGAMFRVSTLDLANMPRTPEGKVNWGEDFFGKEASLTVSGQLNVEAYCLAMSKVYTFGPTFRAEWSFTPRHLAEFWMIEPEIAFADLQTDADLAEAFLKYIFRAVLNERPDDMKFFAERIDKECITRLEKFVESSFERMTYTDAIAALEKAVAGGRKFEFPVKWGVDLQSEHERYLTEEYVKRPVVLINYPKEIKAFYMRLNDDDKTVAAMDVLAPGIGEIIGGSQREERLDVLDRRMDEMKLSKQSYNWYRDLRRYGTVPHAGFGLGFERTIMYATGMQNVRDVIPYPRTPKHAEY